MIADGFTTRQRLLRLIMVADLDPLRALMVIVAVQWCGVLWFYPEKTTALWPIFDRQVWGAMWLGYGALQVVTVLRSRIGRTPLEFAGNCMGVFVMAAWVFAFWSVKTYPPAPVACLAGAFWLLLRTGH